MAKTGNANLTKQLNIEHYLQEAFIQHAINNRGFLKSARRSALVVDRLAKLFWDYMAGAVGETAVTVAASEMAEQGLVVESGARLMQALNRVPWETTEEETAVFVKIGDFQILFLEKLAQAHVALEHTFREQSQIALQRALHSQLDQQRLLQQAQERRNKTLQDLIGLNSHLATLNEENKLLHQAITGVVQILQLDLAAICVFDAVENRWIVKDSTDSSHAPGRLIESRLAMILDNAQGNREGEYREYYQTSDGNSTLLMALTLPDINNQTGGVVTQSSSLRADLAETPILLRAFAQELSSLWRTAVFFQQIQYRSRELEVMQGRYLDSLWNSEFAGVHATYHDHSLMLNRVTNPISDDLDGAKFNLKVGEQPFGHVVLPPGLMLPDEDIAFVEELVKEMGSALNNAKLLQSASASSNQLGVAAEVSRRVTTILDRNVLIEQVVELVRERFGLYYVGLFLVDSSGETAVLQAGTGEAGRIQIERGFKHIVGGPSMIGTAVSQGEAIVEQDVSQAKAFHPNPLLPHTRSELALPLRAGERTIGALTVQHVALGAFPEETVAILQSLADQLAIAIENAGLFTQLESTLTELTTTLSETSNLYETSRHLSEATTATDVFRALIDFAAKSQQFDMAAVVTYDPANLDFLLCPVLWGMTQQPFDPNTRYPFDQFNLGEYQFRLLLIDDLKDTTAVQYTIQQFFLANGFRSLALLPIVYETEWLGTLALCRTQPSQLDLQELQPFVTLADQAAVVLSNQKLLEETNTLYTINNLLTKAITRDLALSEAVGYVARYIGVPQCRFVLFEQQKDVATVVATTAQDFVQKQPTQFEIVGDYVFAALQESGEPLLLLQDDEMLPQPCKARHLEAFDAHASYIIPAASQQELIGYMALDSTGSLRPFTEKNIKFAQAVVEQATIQIENLKLYEDALSRAQELVRLNHIGSAISSTLNINTLSKTVYEQVGTLLDNTIFVLAQYQPENATYTPAFTTANGHRLMLGSKQVKPSEPLYQIIHSDQPVLTGEDTGTFLPQLSRELSVLPRSGIWVALRQEGKPAGFISLQSYDPYAYTENGAQLLRTVATQASLSIANAQLFQRIQKSLEEIQAANAKLRELDELKTQFLANMSHELRTPLNSIIGFSRVILKGIDGPITEAQEEDLNTIYRNGQHLLALINEILDMAKIEAGKMTLSFEQVDLSEIARTVHAITVGLVKESDIALVWNIAPQLPQIEADPIRIRQILINLLSNAAKFTSKGQIELAINQSSNNEVHIAVRDSGIGIAKENYEKLFAAFEQVDSSTTRVVGGTGLGLPITKWLINMHGGSIEVESELNKGTTFHVKLPVKQLGAPNNSIHFIGNNH